MTTWTKLYRLLIVEFTEDGMLDEDEGVSEIPLYFAETDSDESCYARGEELAAKLKTRNNAINVYRYGLILEKSIPNPEYLVTLENGTRIPAWVSLP